jgi:hypothetical protein
VEPALVTLLLLLPPLLLLLLLPLRLPGPVMMTGPFLL